MAKLKNVIKQLSEQDYKAIYDSLIESNAEKSAYLLTALRDRQLTDTKMMVELGVNSNAYYTLRSRLNQKIEEHLLQQMESPRTDMLRKVANLNEILFSKKRTIAIATLKKLEKELQDYDLANELKIVYKGLKKLHVNSPEHFTYSQLYNRHVAYMLAVDKAEDLLADYCKKYGNYFLSGDETEKLGLELLMKEMRNVAKLYDSHRLYVYMSCMLIFHRLFVEKEDNMNDGESIEDIFQHVQKIFATYPLDPLYYHLNLVFEFLKLEYYNHYRVYRQAEKYFEDVNDSTNSLLVNYPYYTFSAQFLISKLERHLRLGKEKQLYEENESLFTDFEPDPHDLPRQLIYVVYRALSAYYAGKFDEAARMLNGFLNEHNLKDQQFMLMELRALLALQYCMMHEFDPFNQLATSVQRQIRLFGKEVCENVLLFLKIMKIATSEAKLEKPRKINALITQLRATKVNYFSPIALVKLDNKFVDGLTRLEF
jgi:hypothetical protein